MMAPDDLNWIGVISDIGVIALLVVIIVGGLKRIWVWGHQYDEIVLRYSTDTEELRQERDRWQDIALRALNVSEAAVERREHESSR